jgi:hypothetical protein
MAFGNSELLFLKIQSLQPKDGNDHLPAKMVLAPSTKGHIKFKANLRVKFSILKLIGLTNLPI